MKQKLLYLLIACIVSTASAFAQVTVSVKNVPLGEALPMIEAQSGYNFFYSSELPSQDANVSVSVKNKSIDDVMNILLKGLPIAYEINGKQIILSKKTVVSAAPEEPVKKTVSGVVKDTSDEPVVGAGVILEGTVTGTMTDENGEFSIEVPSKGAVLNISCISYKTASVPVGKQSRINVVLASDSEFLDEVVVIGYGTQKKVNLTGSVAMIESKELAARPISNVATGLQGLLPGVTVVNASGQPGGGNTTIRVRGVGTIGNSNPLILIDGVEGDISTLNPDDIESVSVLKDAASSAIYGARAANGVLLVTTKKLADPQASGSNASISFGAYFGMQTPTRVPQMCNALEFMELENEALENVGSSPLWGPDAFDKVRNNTAPNEFGNTDWVSSVLRKFAPQQSYNININGSAGPVGYSLSYRYFDQSGLTVGSSTGEKRHNLRFKINTKILDRVSLLSNINYMTSRVTSPVNSLSSGGGAIYNAMRIAPNVPLKYTDGSWAYGGGNTNPVAILHDGGYNKSSVEEISVQEMLKVDILKGWDVSATYNLTSYNGLRELLQKTIVFTKPGESTPVSTYQDPNMVKNTDLRHIQQTLILQTNFDFTFGKNNISGVVGMSQEWYNNRQFEASRKKLLTEADPTINLGDPATQSNDALASKWAIRSGFARVAYNYGERYLIEANLRYDLSSRFHKSNRGGWFPSVSAGWRLSEEKFMAFAKPVVDNIKIRASWGMLGNQYVGSTDYPYMSVLYQPSSDFSLIGGKPTAGYTQSVLANPNLSWETIQMFDVGFDLALFKNRLTFTFDWYDKNTSGILLKLNYPSQIGANPSEQNAGKVNNRGWEIDAAWRDDIGDFSYGIGFNLSDVKNKIVDLAGNAPDLSGNTVRIVGHPIDAFYGYIAEGLMMPEDFKISDKEHNIYKLPDIPVLLGNTYQPGDIKYKDISGPDGVPDGIISPEYDRVIIGSKIPRYTYTINGNIAWKGIDFSIVLQGVGKCDGYLLGSARHAFQDMAGYPQKIHKDRFHITKNPDPNASYPRFTHHYDFNQSTVSTFWLEDASYLRLKNVQIGYTFPEKWMKKARISNLRIYFSGDNLATASKFFYAYDPETPVSKGGYYPQVRTFVFGLNVTFK